MARKVKGKGKDQAKLECRFNCGKTFGSETWKEKHEEGKCPNRRASQEGERAAASLMSRASTQLVERGPNTGDGSLEETPDMPEPRLTKPSLGSSTAAASDMSSVLEALRARREVIIASNPEIRKIDVAIAAVEALKS